MNATDTARQHDPSLCPKWCEGEHLREGIAEDFHHDRAQVSMLLTGCNNEHDDVFVNVSQFQPGQGDAWPVCIELTAQEQTTRLLPAEARDVARLLLEAADTAEVGRG